MEITVFKSVKVFGTVRQAERGDGFGADAAVEGITPLGASTLLELSPDLRLICWSSDLLIAVFLLQRFNAGPFAGLRSALFGGPGFSGLINRRAFAGQVVGHFLFLELERRLFRYVVSRSFGQNFTVAIFGFHVYAGLWNLIVELFTPTSTVTVLEDGAEFTASGIVPF